MVPRATFRGLEIVRLGRAVARFDGEEERLPELFVRGARIYTANLDDRLARRVQLLREERAKKFEAGVFLFFEAKGETAPIQGRRTACSGHPGLRTGL